MRKLSICDLWSLEEYSRHRPQFRAAAIANKSARRIHLGQYITLQFEDELTIRYQIQEMLRIERTFEQEGIQAELDAYNPLIPDGSNLKATMMIEYADELERKAALSKMVGIEHHVWIQCGGSIATAIADEDIERSTVSKTSAVHFLRFEIDASIADGMRTGKPTFIGVTHPCYTEETMLLQSTALTLSYDLD